MSENKKTAIVIGAGASADFSTKKQKEEESSEINMPVGEELVQEMIGFKDEIPQYFLYQYLLQKCATAGEPIHNRNKETFQLAANESMLLLSHYINKAESSDPKSPEYRMRLDDRLTTLTKSDTIKKLTNDDPTFRDFLQKILKEMDIVEVVDNYPAIKKDLDYYLQEILKILPEIKPYYNLSLLLEAYDPPSIDNFLSQIAGDKIDIESFINDFTNDEQERTKLVEAGKELIAFYLLKAEDENIFNANNKIWYRWLRNAIMNSANNVEDIKTYISKNLSLIPFNYDRSLDWYLRTKLSNLYGEVQSQIIYPYGSLNEFGSYEVLGYGEMKGKFNNISRASHGFIANLFLNGEESIIKKFAKGIKVIGERNGENVKDRFAKAAKAIKKANRLYFLGFGFLQENCDELKLTNTKSRRSFYQIHLRNKNSASLYYTNYDNSQKTKNLFESTFYHLEQKIDAITSDRGVYGALEKDFDLHI
jgi:hypothetical protein